MELRRLVHDVVAFGRVIRQVLEDEEVGDRGAEVDVRGGGDRPHGVVWRDWDAERLGYGGDLFQFGDAAGPTARVEEGCGPETRRVKGAYGRSRCSSAFEHPRHLPAPPDDPVEAFHVEHEVARVMVILHPVRVGDEGHLPVRRDVPEREAVLFERELLQRVGIDAGEPLLRPFVAGVLDDHEEADETLRVHVIDLRGFPDIVIHVFQGPEHAAVDIVPGNLDVKV